MDQFPLIATIGFVMAGFLMEPAGITGEIIEVAKKAVGNLRGGLAMVTILRLHDLAALSGSGPATTAAIGSIMIPGMIGAGYRRMTPPPSPPRAAPRHPDPPSNPMIIYGVVANTSIAGLFMAGFIPGFVLTTSMCLTAYGIARKRVQGTGESFSILGCSRPSGTASGRWPPGAHPRRHLLRRLHPHRGRRSRRRVDFFVGLFVYRRKLSWQNISSALIRTSAFLGLAGSATVLVGVSMAFSRL